MTQLVSLEVRYATISQDFCAPPSVRSLNLVYIIDRVRRGFLSKCEYSRVCMTNL